jgi:hypothetical protein
MPLAQIHGLVRAAEAWTEIRVPSPGFVHTIKLRGEMCLIQCQVAWFWKNDRRKSQ